VLLLKLSKKICVCLNKNEFYVRKERQRKISKSQLLTSCHKQFHLWKKWKEKEKQNSDRIEIVVKKIKKRRRNKTKKSFFRA